MKGLLKALAKRMFPGVYKLLSDWKSEIPRLREITQFLSYENSSIRRILRHLVADAPSYHSWIAQTRGSFDFQWQHLPDSQNLLSNPAFADAVGNVVCNYTALPAAWFRGKKVLDAGCGNGRFSWAFAKLGAQVTAFDLSPHGVATLRKLAADASLPINVFEHNILEPLKLEAHFDLVWSYGVLHHTGNTFRGFQNIHPFVAQNGFLFLMLYGDPRINEFGDFWAINQYERLRRKTQNLRYADKIEVLRSDPVVNDIHGWFDAVSPLVNDLYGFEEIEGWLRQAGFDNIRRTHEGINHHVISQRVCKAQAPIPACAPSRKVA